MHLYSTLCIAVQPNALKSCGGGGGGGGGLCGSRCIIQVDAAHCSIHLDDAMAATGQLRQCAHHTPATGGEERVIEPIKWMGLLRGHDWQGPVVGIWPGHRGYIPTLY